jgi:hypothetical protein
MTPLKLSTIFWLLFLLRFSKFIRNKKVTQTMFFLKLASNVDSFRKSNRDFKQSKEIIIFQQSFVLVCYLNAHPNRISELKT